MICQYLLAMRPGRSFAPLIPAKTVMSGEQQSSFTIMQNSRIAMRRSACRLPLLGLCLMVAPASGQAQTDAVAGFYRGKNVTVIVGYTAGGGYDIYARALARHMGRHLPGNPNFVVQNITGAGSLNAANHLYNVSPKDGTVFGTFGRGLAMEPLIGTAKVLYDATRFTWLGSGTNEVSLCATWHTSPVKTWADALRTNFAVGGEGAGSDPDTFSALVRNAFGAKLKLVSGYHGTSDLILAIERGEVDGRCGWSWSSLKSTRPGWITEKKLNYLVHLSEQKAPELAHIPAIHDFASDRQKQILKLVLSRQTMGRPFTAPPGVPEDRKQALRRAFDATLKDPAFLEEADKLKLDVNPVSGAAIDTLVGELYRTPRDVVEETRRAIAP
jgi:tripartite-type tricarboxylate transporter receptor subunit TctC